VDATYPGEWSRTRTRFDGILDYPWDYPLGNQEIMKEIESLSRFIRDKYRFQNA